MDKFLGLLFAAEGGSSESGTSGSGATEKLLEVLKSPILYIVLGSLVALGLLIYFLRRFVKARPNAVVVVVRRGQIYKLVDENNPKYYLVPFMDSVGMVIPLSENDFASDKLFINNGPDHLYKINYALTFKVTNPESFFNKRNNFQKALESKINDGLRNFAEEGNAEVLIKDYRTRNSDILKIINKSVDDFGIEVLSFKVNFIEPLGGK